MTRNIEEQLGQGRLRPDWLVMIADHQAFSPAISRYAYNSETGELGIEFADGRKYRYPGVPARRNL